MKNRLLILIIITILLSPTILNASNDIAHFESVSEMGDTVKILFHSWGEGLTTTIDLDDFFPRRRQENTQYIHITPQEIIITIDQASGIATLKASKDWMGTKEVYFSLVDIYKLYEGQTNLQNYVEEIKKKRESQTIKTTIGEFKDSPVYPFLEALLEKLEEEKHLTETPEITTNFEKPHLEIDVGKTIDFKIGVETKTEEGIDTHRPYLLLNFKPGEEIPILEEGEGYSIWILAPLLIILIVLAIMLYFYAKDNFQKIKKFIYRFVPKKEKTSIDTLSQDIINLKNFSQGFRRLESQINRTPIDKLSDQYFNITKRFFNDLTHPGYEFTYTEINKKELGKDFSEELKEQLVVFSKNVSDIRFSGRKITKYDIKILIEKTQNFIEKIIKDKQKAKVIEHQRILEEKPYIRYITYIKSFLKEGKPKDEPSLEENLYNISKLSKKEEPTESPLQRTLKLFKPKVENIEEMEKKEEQPEIEKQPIKEKLKDRENIIQKILEEQRKKLEIQEKELRKEKEREDAIKLVQEKYKFKLQEEKIKELRRRRKIEDVIRILHGVGLFKTPDEKERKERLKEEILRLEGEKARKEQEDQVNKELYEKELKLIKAKEETILKEFKRKRKLQEEEEKGKIEELKTKEQKALTSKDTKKAHKINNEINKLYQGIQEKSILFGKELHQTYKKLGEELQITHERTLKKMPYLAREKESIIEKTRKLFSSKIEKPKIDEIKLLIKKVEHQFALKKPNDEKINEYFLKANAIYKSLNKTSKSIISSELFKIKNKIGFVAVRSSIKKAEDALKEKQLKKAEEIYNKLSKTYYQLPTKEREKVHEGISTLQQKIKPVKKFKLPYLEKLQKSTFKFPKLYKTKFERQPLRFHAQENLKKTLEKFKTKPSPREETKIKEKFTDFLQAKKPHFPSLQISPGKTQNDNKFITKILKLIRDSYTYLNKKQYQKAKDSYLTAISMFKELPNDLLPEIQNSIYNELQPLKKQILNLSLQNSLQKTKKAVIKGKIKDAKQHHTITSKIYTHLASKREIFIPGPITFKEKQLQVLIKKANDLIENNKIKKVKEIYDKINQLYNEIPPIKKQQYYNRIAVIYHNIVKDEI